MARLGCSSASQGLTISTAAPAMALVPKMKAPRESFTNLATIY
jgi:hypothetical protein